MALVGDDLFDFAEKIQSRADFVRFVEYLNADYRQKPSEWENDTLASFLAGLSGFAQDMGGFYKNMGQSVDIEVVTWRIAAQMLLAAKVYGN